METQMAPARAERRSAINISAIAVYNPYTGGIVGEAPQSDRATVVRAIERMSKGAPKLSRNERSGILRRIAETVRSEAENFSALITSESGLSLKDSKHEVLRSIDVLNLAAAAASFDDSAVYSGSVGANGKPRRIFTQREPIGLVAAITPFNHPLNQVIHKIAPAIATGTPIIVKPSEKTPLTALRLAEVCRDAGMPDELLTIVTGSPAEIAQIFCEHDAVKLLSFTGSSEVGKALMRRAGYRRVVLELGGNDPLIVMEDADVEAAAALAVAGAYGNSGQRCTAVKRILVQNGLADAFVAALAQRTRKVVCGDPANPRTDVGTVIDEASAIRIENRVGRAAAEGAQVVVGGRREGALLHPTVVDRVTMKSELVSEETFGPVAPVIRFDTIDEAIAIANSTKYGLSSGVCSDRLDWTTRFINELRVGSVNIWEVPGYRSELSPFGGIKDSGLGQKEGIAEAMKLYTTIKTFSLPWPNA
jgi:putative phosphonoacetaldehyde dehydrogenase